MGLAYSQIDDAVLLTQNKLIKRGAFVGMQTDLTDHVAVREMWKGRKKKFDGGENWEFNAQMDHNHSARAVGLYEQDGGAMHDTMINCEVAARHVNAFYEYDQREKAFQRGGTAIVDLIKTRYVSMMVAFYEMMEDYLWGKPTDSSDKITPFGIAYWVTRSAQEGHFGGDPAGFADGRGGVSTTEHPRFANYTAKYGKITKEDLIRRMRKAARQTKFRSPVSHATPSLLTGNGIYTNENVVGLVEEILESQNMNLGNDVASKDGKAHFKGTPFTYAPKLDLDSTDPVYMLDWKWLAVGIMTGWENQLTQPYMVPGKHLVRRVDLDASFNMVCTDPRRQAVICK